MVQHDKKLDNMKQCLKHLEARLDKVESEDNRGSKRSKKRDRQRKDSLEVDSSDSKKHKTTFGYGMLGRKMVGVMIRCIHQSHHLYRKS